MRRVPLTTKRKPLLERSMLATLGWGRNMANLTWGMGLDR